MKTFIIGVAVFILMFMAASLYALGTASIQAQSVSAERPAWADAFVQDYEAKHGAADATTQQLLLAGANASCGDLVAKRTLPQVWQMNVDHGMSSDQAATVIELAVQYYCPEYRQLFNRTNVS